MIVARVNKKEMSKKEVSSPSSTEKRGLSALKPTIIQASQTTQYTPLSEPTQTKLTMTPPSRSALSLLLALTTPTLTLARPEEAHVLLPRAYADEICSPNITTTTTTTTTTTIPPCIEITTIEEACAPNGTTPLAYAAHAECMCGGSYFQEWQGCQACLSFHGLRTERDEAFYAAVLGVASHSLCDFLSTTAAAAATPTTDFAALFSAAEATVSQPTTGATVSGSDQAPGETAVSLYFTLSGSQGPGAITGSAASATATATATATHSSTGKSGSASGTTAGKSSSSSKTTTSASGSAAATSTSGSGACPTKAPGGLLLGVAGIAMAVGF